MKTLFVVLLAVTTSCLMGIGTATEQEKTGAKKKRNESRHGFPATAFDYAKMVEPELGVPPTVILTKPLKYHSM